MKRILVDIIPTITKHNNGVKSLVVKLVFDGGYHKEFAIFTKESYTKVIKRLIDFTIDLWRI